METRWRVPEGKTIEGTKVADRIKELHMSTERLDQIKAHLTRNERYQQEHDDEEERVRKVRETSDSMTKDWKDSVQHQQAVRQAELEDMLTKQDDSNFIRFLSVRKEQQAERELYVNEVRQVLLQRKDFPKAVGSAYLMSEVLHEREKQKELAKTIQAQEAVFVKQEVSAVYEDVAKYQAEVAQTKQRDLEKNRAYAEDLMKQVEAIERAQAFQREEKIKEELIDQERGRREAQRIEETRMRKLAETGKMIRHSLNDFRDCQIKERDRRKLENDTQEIMTNVMMKSKDRIQSLMKKKDREAQEARMARGLSTFDNSAQIKRDSDLKLIYDRGLAKLNADQEESDEFQRVESTRIRQEIIDQHIQTRDKAEAKARREQEIKKWQMLNRFKCAEQERQYNEELKKKALEERARLLKERQEEISQKVDNSKQEGLDEVAAINAKNERHDKDYMEYAEEVKELANSQGWNTLPIEKVIDRYKTDTMGIKKPTRCEKMKTEPECANELHAVTIPGRRTHCPMSDPSAKCKHQKERVLQ